MEAHSVLPSTALQAPAGSQPLLSRVPGIGLQTWFRKAGRCVLHTFWLDARAVLPRVYKTALPVQPAASPGYQQTASLCLKAATQNSR